MNWKIVATLIGTLLLAGCQTDQPTIINTTKYRVVIPPDAMMRCPSVNNLPDPDKLTDLQIAHLIEQLSETNAICRASLQQVKIYLTKAKAKFDR